MCGSAAWGLRPRPRTALTRGVLKLPQLPPPDFVRGDPQQGALRRRLFARQRDADAGHPGW
ncbi:hypothetical protein, partial [Streptomyces sp. NPDC001719]